MGNWPKALIPTMLKSKNNTVVGTGLRIDQAERFQAIVKYMLWFVVS